jgi:hypothetical protein
MELDELYERMAMLACPYFKDEGICSGGCRDEPQCKACEPSGGWDGVVYLGKTLRLVPESDHDDPTLRWPEKSEVKLFPKAGWVPCAWPEEEKKGRMPVYFHWHAQLDPSA